MSGGKGNDKIYGGNGNTENIYIHGGKDTVYANEGTKNISIWGNKSDCDIYLGKEETTKTNINLGLVEGNVTSNINESGDLEINWDCYANNTDDDILRLKALTKGLLCHVNVICLNPNGGSLKATTKKEAQDFVKKLL